MPKSSEYITNSWTVFKNIEQKLYFPITENTLKKIDICKGKLVKCLITCLTKCDVVLLNKLIFIEEKKNSFLMTEKT